MSKIGTNNQNTLDLFFEAQCCEARDFIRMA